jgi:glutamate N-acetyltransferase / amino-acid N-acetyltransferase
VSDGSSATAWTGTAVPRGVSITPVDGGLGVIEGVRFAASAVGVRDSAHRDPRAPDLAVLDVGREVPAAIVTTTNQVRAAPCVVGAEHVAGGGIRAVVVNSGNANACTGPRGLVDARAMAAAVADALDCPARAVVPMSTGVIGVPLPVDRIVAGIPTLAGALTSGPVAAAELARAMMTTDSVPKQVAVRVAMGADSALVAGVAKGAGMIEPAMATMLSVIVTDAELDADGCATVLRAVTERTFNRISVDSCGSTNDTVLLLATGTAGAVDRDALVAAVEQVAASLAHLIVTDGEGVTRIARLRIGGAPDDAAARDWGRAIAASALFRTALHGSDPNWGRILAAMGTAATPFDPARVEVRFGPVTVCRDGGAVPYDHAAAVALLREPEVGIDVDLHLGTSSATFLVADLSAGYVQVNAEYTT